MLSIITFVLVYLDLSLAGPMSSIDGDFMQMGDTVHIEFQGRSRWDYDILRSKADGNDVVTLRMPKLSEQLIGKIKAWKGGLLTSVDVKPNGLNGKTEIQFKLKENKVLAFDYLTDDPSRLIVDFYIDEDAKPETEKKEAKTAKVETKTEETVLGKPTKLPPKKAPKRQPAASEFIKGNEKEQAVTKEESTSELRHGIFDGGDPDFTRFTIKDYEIREEAKIASQRNIYIVFPALKLEHKQLKELLDTPPIYEIVPEETEENKLARLLLTLFNKKRYAVYLKTLEFFQKKFPDSKYNEIISYMEADVYYSLWQKDKGAVEYQKAITLYRALVEKYPKSPLAERTLLLIAFSHLDRSDSLNTLMALQRFIRYQPDSKYFDSVRLAVAEAYQDLKKPQDAIKTFEEVITSPKSQKAAIDSNYLIGDVYFQQGDFEKSISSYDKAISKHPKDAKDYPNAFYNKAESLFWLGRHRESLEAYREFLRRFPAHNHCGFAMTRLGELLEILGADQRRIIGAFLESYFRYRGSEGAKIARVRVISHRMKDMRPKELESALQELKGIEESSTLNESKEFITIMISDGYFTRKEYDKSIDKLVEFYQQNPTSPNLSVFKKRIIRSISEKVKDLVDEGEAIQALREYSKFAENWLKGDDRIDVRYYLAKALEKSGVVDQAASVYRDILNKIYAIKGTSLEKERNVFETVPTTDTLNLRLAAVARKKRDFGLAGDYLGKISEPQKMTTNEQIERVEIIAEVAEKRGDVNLAKESYKKLIETWKGQPAEVASSHLHLGKLEMKTKNYAEAHSHFQKLINLAKDSNEVSNDVFAESLKLQGDALVALKRPNDAIPVYSELLEKFEPQRSLESVRFTVGKLMFDRGDIKGAEQTWKPLQEKQNNLWGKIASEKLREMQFSQDYNKYIKRIPAMEGKGN